MVRELAYESTSRTVDAGAESVHRAEVDKGTALLFLHGTGAGVSGWVRA